MPKKARKAATKKAPAKAAKKKSAARATAKKNTPARPAAARNRAVTATPARVLSRHRNGKNVITAVIGSATTEDISVRAYYIGERRRSLGLPGDSESDWFEAERQTARLTPYPAARA